MKFRAEMPKKCLFSEKFKNFTPTKNAVKKRAKKVKNSRKNAPNFVKNTLYFHKKRPQKAQKTPKDTPFQIPLKIAFRGFPVENPP